MKTSTFFGQLIGMLFLRVFLEFFLQFLEFTENLGKEPVLPLIGQNWHDVKIDGMSTQFTMYNLSVLIFCCFYLDNVHIKECTFDIFDKPILQVYQKKS